MAQILIKRGSNLQHTTYTGALGELTLNTDTKAVHAHDGATAGGVALAKADDVGAVSSLTTTSKVSAVAAINELKTAVDGKQAALGYTAENAANKGQANGYASLDASGIVPASQLPSYVDDVVEAANFASLPASGEAGKIYVTIDTGNTYRWSGSAYIQIGQNVANAEQALKLTNARTIAVSGAVEGSGSFDGSANLTIVTTLAASTVIDGGTM